MPAKTSHASRAEESETVSTYNTITLSDGALNVAQNVYIQGPGASQLAVSGNNASMVFEIGRGVTASLSGLTIEDGHPAGHGIGELVLLAGPVLEAEREAASGGLVHERGDDQVIRSRVGQLLDRPARSEEIGQGPAVGRLLRLILDG